MIDSEIFDIEDGILKSSNGDFISIGAINGAKCRYGSTKIDRTITFSGEFKGEVLSAKYGTYMSSNKAQFNLITNDQNPLYRDADLYPILSGRLENNIGVKYSIELEFYTDFYKRPSEGQLCSDARKFQEEADTQEECEKLVLELKKTIDRKIRDIIKANDIIYPNNSESYIKEEEDTNV